MRFGPGYSLWSNGLNEINHYSADTGVKKMMEHESDLSLEKAVEIAAWTHNSNVNRLGSTPLTLVTGKTVFFPRCF